jgi:hypothetical protein
MEPSPNNQQMALLYISMSDVPSTCHTDALTVHAELDKLTVQYSLDVLRSVNNIDVSLEDVLRTPLNVAITINC